MFCYLSSADQHGGKNTDESHELVTDALGLKCILCSTEAWYLLRDVYNFEFLNSGE